MNPYEIKLDPLDVLNSRLDQALSVLICLANTYEDAESGFTLPNGHLYNVIWSVQDQLTDAQAALSAIFEERETARLRGAA